MEPGSLLALQQQQLQALQQQLVSHQAVKAAIGSITSGQARQATPHGEPPSQMSPLAQQKVCTAMKGLVLL